MDGQWTWSRHAGRILAAVLLVASPSLTNCAVRDGEPAPRMRVTKPSGGKIRAIEFFDAAGNVTKRFEPRRSFTKGDHGKLIEEVALEAVAGYALVTESRRFETASRTDQEAEKSWEIENTITLYDETGQVLFQKTDEDCFPVALAEDAGKVACLHSAPHDGNGWASAGEIDPQQDRLSIFFSCGKLARTIKEPAHHIDRVKLSPSGIWLAYVRGQIGKSAPEKEIELLNLITGRQISVPLEEDPRLASFVEVLDDGELRTFEEIDVRQPDGSYILERRPVTLFRVMQ